MKTLRPLLCCLFVAALVASSPRAEAQPVKDAKYYYEKGQAAYTLGEWKKAIENYKRAYEEDPSLHSMLFNIAQAYRLDGNCQKAIFFYRRYLDNVPNAGNRATVEEFIADQTKACEAKGKDPTEPISPDPKPEEKNGTTGNPTTTTTTGNKDPKGTGDTKVAVVEEVEGDDDDDDDDGSIATTATIEQPKLISAHVSLGGSLVRFGDPALKTDPLFSLAVGGGYPLPVGPMTLELGGMVTYTPVPWENAQMETGTASLTALMASAAAMYPIPSFPKLSIRGEAGLGVQWFGGLTEPGVVFLDQGSVATGALAAFHLRAAAGAEYLVTPNVTINAFPLVFAYSPSGDLRESISSVTRFEVLVGAGYRM